MTGAEHYAEAEKIMRSFASGVGMSAFQQQVGMAAAHVHATLALAAATSHGVVPRQDDEATS